MLKYINNWRLRRPSHFAIAVTCIFAWLCTYLSVNVMYHYSWVLFMLVPFSIGFLSTLLHGYAEEATNGELAGTAFISLGIYCAGLLLFAMEGIVCLLMAAPFGALLTCLGYLVAGFFVKNKGRKTSSLGIWLTVFAVPALTAFEGLNKDEPGWKSVTTSVEIAASPEAVWKNVITFPQLKAPTEMIFKTGIAYPINATIQGTGVGAIRRCNFSTGSFVEPITVWDEPKLLRFSVQEQPETMKEISPYELHPRHLHGYWVSKQGQFKLTPLPNGDTLLEGTTWYVNKIEPGFYWTLWSDYIVHTIHNRVLQHIKEEAETGKQQTK